MSGAEAIFVLGLVANIVQIVDITYKVLERITDAKDQVCADRERSYVIINAYPRSNTADP